MPHDGGIHTAALGAQQVAVLAPTHRAQLVLGQGEAEGFGDTSSPGAWSWTATRAQARPASFLAAPRATLRAV